MIDPVKPYSWEEAVVNLVVLDMLKKNQAHTEFNFAEGFATFSYPNIQENAITKKLQDPFI